MTTLVLPTTVTAVADRPVPLLCDVAPAASLPATVTTATADQQRALGLARTVHSVFDTTTAAFGDSLRSPLRRLGTKAGTPFIVTIGVGCLTAAAGGIASGVLGMAGVNELFRQAASFVVFGSVIAGTVFGAAALAEIGICKRRTLGSDAIAPIRQAYDAAAPQSLERAVVARLAASYLTDLNDRFVVGEAPRAALREIVALGETLGADVKQAAGALVECFLMVHDEEGKQVRELNHYTARKLELALARTQEPLRDELRQTLMATLFNGDRLRPTASSDIEARLYLVLTGAEAPATPPAIETPTLDGDALRNAARELESNLFDQDGEWARHLSADDARKLFAILRTAGSDKTES